VALQISSGHAGWLAQALTMTGEENKFAHRHRCRDLSLSAVDRWAGIVLMVEPNPYMIRVDTMVLGDLHWCTVGTMDMPKN
jgi:hypothetical protein